MKSAQGVARRYGKALMGSATEAGVQEAVAKDLEAASSLLAESEEFRLVYSSPLFDPAERREAVGTVAKELELQQISLRFLKLLVDKDRTDELDRIATTFRELLDEQEGRVRVKLVTAGPVDDKFKDAVRKQLEGRTGKQVMLEHGEDPSLMGGAVAWIGDKVYDGSIKAQLAALEEKLLEES